MKTDLAWKEEEEERGESYGEGWMYWMYCEGTKTGRKEETKKEGKEMSENSW